MIYYILFSTTWWYYPGKSSLVGSGVQWYQWWYLFISGSSSLSHPFTPQLETTWRCRHNSGGRGCCCMQLARHRRRSSSAGHCSAHRWIHPHPHTVAPTLSPGSSSRAGTPNRPGTQPPPGKRASPPVSGSRSLPGTSRSSWHPRRGSRCRLRTGCSR